MPRIQKEVRSILQDPDPDSYVSLLVTVENGKQEIVASILKNNSPALSVEQLPYKELLVKIAEEHIRFICSMEDVSRVELDERMEVFSSGNFPNP